jgi:hypothetical protein
MYRGRSTSAMTPKLTAPERDRNAERMRVLVDRIAFKLARIPRTKKNDVVISILITTAPIWP